MSDYPDENLPRCTPLTCEIENEQLVIRIGIDTLAWAAEHGEMFYDDERHGTSGPPYIKVCDKLELAKDVLRELQNEQEDGTTPVHLLLDQAILDAAENGSMGFEEE